MHLLISKFVFIKQGRFTFEAFESIANDIFNSGNIRRMCLHLPTLCHPLASIRTGDHLKAIKEFMLEFKMQLNAINKEIY